MGRCAAAQHRRQAAAWAGSHQFVLPTQKTPTRTRASPPGCSSTGSASSRWSGRRPVRCRPATRSASRRSSRRSRTRPCSARRSTTCTSRRRFRASPTPLEWDKALNESVLGIKEPQAALSDAAGRANKILEANKKKYGRPPWPPRLRSRRPAGPGDQARAGKETRFGGVHGLGRPRTSSCCPT